MPNMVGSLDSEEFELEFIATTSGSAAAKAAGRADVDRSLRIAGTAGPVPDSAQIEHVRGVHPDSGIGSDTKLSAVG
jgi:hypothetical protein